jgi:hypothetical protein
MMPSMTFEARFRSEKLTQRASLTPGSAAGVTSTADFGLKSPGKANKTPRKIGFKLQ